MALIISASQTWPSRNFTLSPTRWIEATNAIGLVSKSGRYGGTYAISDIAFKFANWVSVEFELYLVMEFQRLKAKEQELLGWTAKRELSKINYRIHTDAIKSHLIPEEVTKEQANFIYVKIGGTVPNFYTLKNRPDSLKIRGCRESTVQR